MSLGSINSSTLSAAAYDTTKLASDRTAAKADAAEKSIADHVAADSAQEPVPHVSTTQGTLVDTYL